MAHNHALTDSNARYIIDPVTRTMRTENDQPVVIQFDHDSERLTFELPRYIDGHDATLCDKVRVHYINVDTVTKDQYRGLYDVRDLQVSPDDPEKAICSWVISRNATQYVGSLSFILRLACTDDDGEEVYGWSTAKYASLYVSEGINNDDAIVEEYADILTQWQRELVAAGGVKTVNGIRPDLSGNVNVEAIDWEVTETVNEGAEVYAERELAFTSKFTSLPNLGTALVEGEDYVVYWNGTAYPCKCFVDDGTLYLGNGSLSAGFTVDTGEPFLIQSFGGTNGMIFKATRTEETVTVRICSAEIVQHKTVPKHQLPEDIGGVNVTGATPGQMLLVKAVDENGKPTEWETVDRTHYEGEPVIVEALPEVPLTFPEDEPMAVMAMLGLVAGETYTVNWNGSAYECTAVEITGDGITGTFIGNQAAIGGEDNGLPFVMGDIPAQGVAMCVALDGSTQATVGITQVKRGIKKLDNKYLDLDWMPTKTVKYTDILPETATPTPTVESNGMYNYTLEGATAAFVEGKEYSIWLDGVEYTDTARLFTSDFMWPGIGNANMALPNVDATDYPFVAFAVTNITLGTTAPVSTVRIAIKETSYNKMPSGFMPEGFGTPYFDLSALGLGAIGLDASSSAAVDFDTITAIRNALDAGPVKLKYSIGFDAGSMSFNHNLESIVTATIRDNSVRKYPECDIVRMLDFRTGLCCVIHFEFNLTDSGGSIYAYCVLLGSDTTTATT